MDVANEVLQIIGTVVVAGGGLSLIVYQVFKHLAVKWLDARFAERLQALKHQHQREIEALRFKIAALLDRATKLHAREFEVLPQAWSRLNDAYWLVSTFVAPFQRYADLNRLQPAQLESFLKSSPLKEWEIDEVRQATDLTKAYQKKIFWHNLGASQTKARDANTYLAKNGIFINDDIRARFTTLYDLVWNALLERELEEEMQNGPRQPRDHIDRFRKAAPDLVKELERTIHERLWPANERTLTVDSAGLSP